MAVLSSDSIPSAPDTSKGKIVIKPDSLLRCSFFPLSFSGSCRLFYSIWAFPERKRYSPAIYLNVPFTGEVRKPVTDVLTVSLLFKIVNLGKQVKIDLLFL